MNVFWLWFLPQPLPIIQIFTIPYQPNSVAFLLLEFKQESEIKITQ